MRHIRERFAARVERVECRSVVQRRDLRPFLDVRQQPVLDHRRLEDEVAEVDDPVADRVCLDEVVDGCRAAALVHERELEARRAGVDDEDVQPGHVQSRISGSSSPCSRV